MKVEWIEKKGGGGKGIFSDSDYGHLNVSAGSNGKGAKEGLGRTKDSDHELGDRHIILWVVVYADWRVPASFQKLNYMCTMFNRSWEVNTQDCNSAPPSRLNYWRLWKTQPQNIQEPSLDKESVLAILENTDAVQHLHFWWRNLWSCTSSIFLIAFYGFSVWNVMVQTTDIRNMGHHTDET